MLFLQQMGAGSISRCTCCLLAHSSGFLRPQYSSVHVAPSAQTDPAIFFLLLSSQHTACPGRQPIPRGRSGPGLLGTPFLLAFKAAPLSAHRRCQHPWLWSCRPLGQAVCISLQDTNRSPGDIQRRNSRGLAAVSGFGTKMPNHKTLTSSPMRTGGDF